MEFNEAADLLDRYLAETNATKIPEAEQLLAEFVSVNSESAAINTLVSSER